MPDYKAKPIPVTKAPVSTAPPLDENGLLSLKLALAIMGSDPTALLKPPTGEAQVDATAPLGAKGPNFPMFSQGELPGPQSETLSQMSEQLARTGDPMMLPQSVRGQIEPKKPSAMDEILELAHAVAHTGARLPTSIVDRAIGDPTQFIPTRGTPAQPPSGAIAEHIAGGIEAMRHGLKTTAPLTLQGESIWGGEPLPQGGEYTIDKDLMSILMAAGVHPNTIMDAMKYGKGLFDILVGAAHFTPQGAAIIGGINEAAQIPGVGENVVEPVMAPFTHIAKPETDFGKSFAETGDILANILMFAKAHKALGGETPGLPNAPDALARDSRPMPVPGQMGVSMFSEEGITEARKGIKKGKLEESFKKKGLEDVTPDALNGLEAGSYGTPFIISPKNGKMLYGKPGETHFDTLLRHFTEDLKMPYEQAVSQANQYVRDGRFMAGRYTTDSGSLAAIWGDFRDYKGDTDAQQRLTNHLFDMVAEKKLSPDALVTFSDKRGQTYKVRDIIDGKAFGSKGSIFGSTILPVTDELAGKGIDELKKVGGFNRKDLEERITEATIRDGGSTINPRTGEPVSRGYSVALTGTKPDGTGYGLVVENTPEAIRSGVSKLLDKHEGLLSFEGMSIGTWIDGDKAYIDLAFNAANKSSAIDLARRYNQKSVWDLKNNKAVETLGTGEERPDFPPLEKRVEIAANKGVVPGEATPQGIEAAKARVSAEPKKLGATGVMDLYERSRKELEDAGYRPPKASPEAVGERFTEVYGDAIRERMASEKAASEAFGEPHKGWYDVWHDTVGELQKDGIKGLDTPAGRDLFNAVTSALSNGASPLDELRFGLQEWQSFQNGEKLGSKQRGTRGSTTIVTLQKIQALVDEMGVEGAVEWLKTEHPLAEVLKRSTTVKPENGPGKPVYGAAILGPKIGNYFLNKSGNLNVVTKDIWWNRSWRALMGELDYTHGARYDKEGKIVEEPSLAGSNSVVERRLMNQAVEMAAKKLDLTPAELQAYLWSVEQEWANKQLKSDMLSYNHGEALKELKKDGTLDEITGKSFGPPESTGPIPGPGEGGPRPSGGKGGAGGAGKDGIPNDSKGTAFGLEVIPIGGKLLEKLDEFRKGVKVRFPETWNPKELKTSVYKTENGTPIVILDPSRELGKMVELPNGALNAAREDVRAFVVLPKDERPESHVREFAGKYKDTPKMKEYMKGGQAIKGETYHGTGAEFNTFRTQSAYHFGTHVGDFYAAADFANRGDRLLPLVSNAKKTIELPDIGTWDAYSVAREAVWATKDKALLADLERFMKEDYDIRQKLEDGFKSDPKIRQQFAKEIGFVGGAEDMLLFEYSRIKRNEIVQKIFEKHGIDAIEYTNRAEGIATRAGRSVENALRKEGYEIDADNLKELVADHGSKSYIVWDPRKLKNIEGNTEFNPNEPNMFKMSTMLPLDEQNIKKYAGSVNLERLAGLSELERKRVLDYAKDISKEIEKVTGKPVTVDEVLEAAKDAEPWKKIIPHEERVKVFGAVLKLREMVNMDIRKDRLDTPEAKERFLQLNSVASYAGQLLRFFRENADAVEWGTKEQLYQRLVKLGNDIGDIQAKGKDVDWNDSRSVAKFYREFVKPKASEVIDELRYISMLSSPRTHVVNAFSNLIQTGITAPATKLSEAATDFVISKATGAERTRFASEVPAFYRGAANSIPDASKAAVRAFLGKEALTNLDLRRIPSAGESEVKLLKPVSKLNDATRFVTNALEAGDRFFRVLVEGGERESLIHQAKKQGKTPDMREINEKARKSAEYYVFRKMLDPKNKTEQGKLLSKIDEVTMAVQNAGHNVKAIRWVVPFIQTPMNIFKQGIEYSPAGFLTMIGAGDNQRLQFSKAMVGSLVAAGAAGVVSNAETTWDVPKNQSEKADFYAQGKLPYAIKIGDKWVQVNRLGPLSYPIAMAMIAKHANKPGSEMSAIPVSLLKFLGEQSYMQGLNNLNEALSDPERQASRFVASNARQVIPLGSLMRWTNNFIDRDQRVPEGVTQKVLADVPVYSKTLAERKGPLGDTQKKPDLAANLFQLSPVNVSRQSKNPVIRELGSKGVVVGLPSRVVFGERLDEKRYQDYVGAVGSLVMEALQGSQEELKSMKTQDLQEYVDYLVRQARTNVRNEMFQEERQKYESSQEDEE